MKSIQEVQEEIEEEFSILADDKESTIYYIMELGNQLPTFPEEERVDANIIKGCQSKVWLTTQESDGQVIFLADSNNRYHQGTNQSFDSGTFKSESGRNYACRA